MQTIRLLPLLCFSFPLFSQTINTPSPGPVKTKLEVMAAPVRTTQIRNAQAFSVAPQVVDGLEAGGVVWTTQIVLVNLNPNSAEPYELNFYDANGNPALVTLIGPGMVDTVSGSLNPGQTIRYTTAGLVPSVQTTWASVFNGSTGADISLYEAVRDTVPTEGYYAETQVSCDFGIYNTTVNPGGFMPFDNTNGAYTALNMVNPDITNSLAGATSVLVQVYDTTGTRIGTHTVTLTPGQHTAFLANGTWPETDNVQGTLYFLPSTGTFTPITVFGLRSYVSGTYKTISTISLLQVTCPGTGCP